MKDLITRLFDIIQTMDVPDTRREGTMLNVLWLNRNLGVNNRGHPQYAEAMTLIHLLLSET